MQPSNSDNVPSTGEDSESFFLLDEKIRRWVWSQGWTELREAQERAIRPILSGITDIIIAAATASGKTEAAFLPICSKLLEDESQDAIVIYLSPLKALINDQFSRMEQLCEELDIPVYPWHGDISASRKSKFLKHPSGILLITPESLESLFVNHGHAIPTIFNALLYAVVDELHSFIGSERGRQLQSLLHRLEFAIKRKVPRIGLSATIGDMVLAADFLRPGYADNVNMILSNASGQELKLLLKGYLQQQPALAPSQNDDQEEPPEDGSDLAIGESLFKTLRGSSNLIFANSRNRVEYFADLLRKMCEDQHIPNEFWPHHGSLSKELREDAEMAIKDKSRPVSIACTSTLEMGIDIGAIANIAQLGVPPSVASMRQRLGRSGRRGDPAILRIYLQEEELTDKSSLADCLRAGLVQTIAMVRLLLAKWYEPPPESGLHISTLVQQLLSIIAQYGGVTAAQAWNVLCVKGPFGIMSQQLFADVLKSMGSHKLLMQASDGLLLHGQLGERIVNHYSFYAAFAAPEEYRLVTGARTIGTLPIDRPVSEGSYLIFGGRRWLVLSVDSQKRVIDLKPAKGGKPPVFGGQSGWIHDRIRQEMLEVYKEKSIPVFLDVRAQELLAEGKKNFQRYDLQNQRLFSHGNITYLFCWMGDRAMDTIAAMLRAKGLKAVNEGIAIIVIQSSAEELTNCLRVLINEGVPDAFELAMSIDNKAKEKYDLFLTDELLSADYAASKLDSEGALKAISNLHDFKFLRGF